MLSLSPAMSAGQAGGYFSKEDYYLREADLGDNSRWCGEGARELGLEGPVQEDDFRALCRGEAPGGERLVGFKQTRDHETGALIETHRAGNDCTFSPPKSVSVTYACGVDGVKEAHDAAVLSVARHLEEHHSFYRTPEGLKAGKLVAAKFDHATSRNIDPQLHSHFFVLNLVQTPEGEWRANEPKGIYQEVKSLGLLYRLELARELEARGFGIYMVDRSQMLFELRGIDLGLIEHFSTRRVEIEAQVASWQEEGKFAGVAHGRLYEMAALETRDPKHAMSREEVVRIFEQGFEACGTTPLEVKRGLELSLAPSLTLPGPELSAVESVQLAAHELTEHEAVFKRERLLDLAARISGPRPGLAELNAAIDRVAPGLVRIGTDQRGREHFTTGAMLELEAGNLERVRELAAVPFRSLALGEEVEVFRNRLALEGVRPTAGQWREFSNEVTGGSSFLLTVGDPGVAKTRTLGLIERFNEEVLRPDGREPCTINLAYTGKAAREMSLATGRPAFTVDSFLNAASKFALQRQNSELPILDVSGEQILISREVPTIIRVDEAGFLGARQARELMDVVGDLNERGVQVKLHLLGDTKQMQAIAAGDFLSQVQELGVEGELEYAHLNEILRQRDPELKEIAQGLNREDRPLAENAREALVALGRRQDLTEIADERDLTRVAVEHYLAESRKPSLDPERSLAGEGQSVLMVTPTNEKRKELNREVRQARIALGEIEEGKPFRVLSPVRQDLTVEGYQPGDRLVFTGERDLGGRLRNWGARIGTEAEVIGIVREKNLVQVRYEFSVGKEGHERTRSVTREFPARELAGRSVQYREEERNFAVGDRVVALRNEHKLDLQNGTLGTIRELDRNGRAVLDVGERTVELDLTRYRQLDHAYAVTIHKSQGATVEHSILVAVVEQGPKRERGRELEQSPQGQLTYNALNVAVTRAQYGTHIFTNSIEGLEKSVERVEIKSSTLKREPGLARVPGRELSQAWSRDFGERVRELSQSFSVLDRKAPRLNLEQIKIPPLPAHVRELFRPAPSIPPPQKSIGKELELTRGRSLGKGFGLEM
jgi:conjugative relaxase-like TrwC/TraI family protein